MNPAQIRSLRFRSEREADWRRLEALLNRAERNSGAQLSDDDLLALPLLYRSACASLSVARATVLDASLTLYLEGLVSRAYFFVYGARVRVRDRVLRFFTQGWPNAVRSIWRETLAAAVILFAAAVVGFFVVRGDQTWYDPIMGGMSQGRDFSASTDSLREIIHGHSRDTSLGEFAAALFTHNAQVSLLAFALGFAFCAPTALFMAQNGLMLGGLIALYASRDLTWPVVGWLFIHGTTELFAVTLSGAAGFRIGWAVMFPGERSRVDAAAAAGVEAGRVMAGVVIMLAVAGVLEGIGRQLIDLDAARMTVAAFALFGWFGYFYLRPTERGP